MTDEQKDQPSNVEKQLETEKKRSEEYLNRLKYLQADFENLKKRCDRQLQEAKSYATERLVLELLDVVDELELAMKTGQTLVPESQPLLEGVHMTLKKFRKVLEQEGVSPIECEGQDFDPTIHNAVAKIEREGVKGCLVGEEVRKGYIMKGKVIRPSIVKVEVPPSPSSKSQKENQTEKKENE
ncbi:MAG TPA: nucleotide exchange factor GrpE [Candidatus Bathyarchaeia archaeon]|nr:nucleotide exchange factor GrpE [Candidatus Bathyarchaeia archaeon]